MTYEYCRQLPDGADKKWDTQLISQYVKRKVAEINASAVSVNISFISIINHTFLTHNIFLYILNN